MHCLCVCVCVCVCVCARARARERERERERDWNMVKVGTPYCVTDWLGVYTRMYISICSVNFTAS